jgi:threonine dehydrogenase-like Zn-dependent dehydrogenase
MTRIRKNQQWKCNTCGSVVADDSLLFAPSPFNPDNTLIGCPECLECDEGFTMLCDEPGCLKPVSCGWHTGNDSDEFGGGRNTCGKHYGGDFAR